MKDIVKGLGIAMVCCTSATWAQQAPPAGAQPEPAKATAQSEAGEPRAGGGDPLADAQDSPSTVGPPGSGGTAPAAGGPAPGRPAPGRPAPATPGRGATASTAPAAAGGQKADNPRSAAADKLQLGAATVTGDREQPKVMYVVPWKRSDIGDAQGKPMNSLIDEILSPVDRDTFKREVRYYQTIESGTTQNGAPAAERVER